MQATLYTLESSCRQLKILKISGPIVNTSGSFLDMQQRWSATENEVFAAYQSVLKFDLHLGEANCVFHCSHKPVEPSLSKDITIPKLKRWSVELADYNIMSAYIKGQNSVMMDAISRLKTLNIHKEPLEKTKTVVVSNTQEHVMEMHSTDIHAKSTTMLHTKQK